ncbi:ABC transporter substrate-binding protein [Thermostichus sp. MS-CIW-25]
MFFSQSIQKPRMMKRRDLLKYGAACSATLALPVQQVRRVEAATSMSFQFDWKFNAQFAGVFVGIDAGLYAEKGIALEPRPWSDGVNVVAEVAMGKADFACAEQNLILAAQADGASVKAIATMFKASPYGLMTTPNQSLSSLADLRGKRVGVHLDGLKIMALVKGVNGIEDIEVVEIPYSNKYERVLSGEFAAVQCYVIDEPIGVAKQFGVEPKVLKLSDHGLLSTAQTIVASEATLADKPELVRAAMAATFEGWKRALADKPKTAAMIVERFVPEGSPYKDVAYQTRTLELLEPYVTAGGRLGEIDPTVWKKAAELMMEYGILESLPDLTSTLAPGFVS